MKKQLFALSLFALTATVSAEEALPDYAHDTLSGDWQGQRKALYQRGVDIGFNLKADWLRSVGGATPGNAFMWLGDAKLKLDADKLFGWTATTFYFQLQTAYGGKLNQHATGSTMGVDNLEVPVSTTKLFHAWGEKAFADGKYALLLGLYPIDAEFYVTDASGIFLHPSFGMSAEIASTAQGNGANGRAPSIFNSSSLGMRFKWQPTPGYYAQLALNDGRPVNSGQERGTHINLARGDGSLAIVELGLKPGEAGWLNQKDKKFDGISKFAVGAWQYNPQFDDWQDVDSAGQAVRRRNRGVYVLAEQTLMGSLSAFVRHGTASARTSYLSSSTSLGISGKGLFAARPNDTYGLATTRARLSKPYRDAQAVLGNDVEAYEQVVEATYRAQLAPYLALQPSVQYIKNPAANPQWKNAVVYGARLEVAF